jgi:hypothetical protein
MLLFQLNLQVGPAAIIAPARLLIALQRNVFIPAPQRAVLITAQPRILSLKATYMPVVGSFSSVDPPERLPFSIDFAAQIPAGDSLTSILGSALAAYVGTDDDAAGLLYGPATIAGTVVTQTAGPGWIPGVIYRLTLTCGTAGGATISLYAHITAQAQI